MSKDEFSKWHKRACVYSECDACGIDLLPLCPFEEEGLHKKRVKWKCFEIVDIITKKREPQ